MEFVFEHATMIAVIAVVVIILAILASGYVKAPPDTAFIISGFQKGQRILIGKAGIKLPFFERLDKLSLKLVAIDVKTSDAVPTADYINIQVDAAVNIKVGDEPQKLQKASQNFLNRDSEYIAKVAREVLEGNMREIVGKMRLEEMVSDRQKFAELVKDNAEPDLAAMGLDIISFNVQNFVDSNQVIENLGIDNIVKIKKSAAIARANSEKEIKIAQARANKEANDERVLAETEIAKKNNDLAIKSAELKKESDIKKAEADAAYKIQEEQQRKELEITSANANIARQEREVELRAREVEVTEKSLEAEVKKKAEAERYAKQQQAEADLYRRQKDAEADQFEKIREAEAKKAQAEAQRYAMEQEALGIKAKGEAEAASIRAQALAEAEGMEKKAEAYQRYNKAAMAEMMIKVAEAIAYNKNSRHILIVENNGAIANMQDDAMVEVVCELGINGPRPMRVGNIPQFYLGLLVNQVSSEKLIVDAYYEHSYEKALQAFTLNRLVGDAKKARKVLDALIEANKGMWPELK